ncbi:helix-turn-helix domain-containing protein [Streptomyces diastaticus]|uniref:winged helix-turn-helix transcriptional regulator n=1 Tax=Streptomyces TaxID=1883 RepID=UPI001864EFA9
MCAPRSILEHGTSRWGVLVLIALAQRSCRFSELRRAVDGVSEKTLQTLERDGIVHRDAHPVIPPRVDYSLTPLGQEAAGLVRSLARWTGERLTGVEAARREYDARREATGKRRG